MDIIGIRDRAARNVLDRSSSDSSSALKHHAATLILAFFIYQLIERKRTVDSVQLPFAPLFTLIMPNREDVTYFGAGPALLPTEVLQTATAGLLNYNEIGVGLAELSHRSDHAANIISTTKADLANYLGFSQDDYDVIYMQGGGSGQFSATVYNMVGIWVARRKERILKELGKDISEDVLVEALEKAISAELSLDYLITGSWSLKASQEAVRLVGTEHVNIATDARKASADGKFGSIPAESTWKLSKSPALVYYCDNETVDGVEFPGFPKALEPNTEHPDPIVVADMSSNILSRKVDVNKFSVIFFGAQKNLGMAGITVVLVKKSLLPPTVTMPSPVLLRKLGLPVPPTIFCYDVIAKNNSLYNTTSIFDVYLAGQVLQRLLKVFPDKVNGQQAVADEKAKLIYDALDANSACYRVVPEKSVRSRMNICFRVTKGGNVNDAEKDFLKGASEIGLLGLKGHRSVGGIRASNYNSIPLEGAKKLAEYINNFAKA
ncbi:pyridoxal phosphate-dependent transferase [Xylogone sp. PMI_703]|nr:pyridoxal phosphate-dependent transferase [Xylogone sp. PMI_703]